MKRQRLNLEERKSMEYISGVVQYVGIKIIMKVNDLIYTGAKMLTDDYIDQHKQQIWAIEWEIQISIIQRDMRLLSGTVDYKMASRK